MRKCLIIVDMQNDFINKRGSLYVPESEEIISNIKDIHTNYNWDLIVFTQDWHPKNHISFLPVGSNPSQNFNKDNLWNPHCIQNTWGARIIPDLDHLDGVWVQKGYDKNIDSYSAFHSKDSRVSTGLKDILTSRFINQVYVCGVAGDYCVYYTCLNSKSIGFKTFLISNAIRNIHKDTSTIIDELMRYGINIVNL